MECPNCGAASTGAFCGECGAPLRGAKCRSCGAALPPGSNYCTNCGDAVQTGARRTSNAPWYLAGGALLILIVVLMWPTISGRHGDATEGRVPLSQLPEAGVAGATDDQAATAPQGPLTGTPREQADRLFNRVMTERENGDTARAKFFLPMAIQAYQIAGDLDADGSYHLSILQAFSGDYQAARETAEHVLATQPNHLLALSAAASAASHLGDRAAARRDYQKFLSAYDSEIKTGKEEYQDHSRILPELKKEAEAYVR